MKFSLAAASLVLTAALLAAGAVHAGNGPVVPGAARRPQW